MRSTEKNERNHELLAYRMAGHSNKECAEVFQLTASRVGQIIRRQFMIEARDFLDRESGIFAFALNRAFCYPIRKRVLDGHYFCVSELEGRPVYIDVRGITTSWAHFCYTEQATAEGMSSPIDEKEVRNEAIQRLGENRFEQLREAATSFIATSWYGTYDVEGFDEKLQKKARMEGESS